MVPEPTTLDVGATAQDAAELLADRDVRAVFVSADDGRLVGVITRKTLVREVVAAGLDPTSVRLDAIAEPPLNTLDAGLALDDAFRFLEEGDLERVPVVEDGRLVGVLSRSVVQRRLAEDEPPEDGDAEDPAARSFRLAAGVRAGRCSAFDGRGQLRRGERCAVEDVALARLDRVEREKSRISVRITAPATITGARSGSSAGTSRRSASGSAASRSSCVRAAAVVSRWPSTRARS